MKTKIILFLGVAAIATLSFTFVSVTGPTKSSVKTTTEKPQAAPIGGLVSGGSL